MKNMFNLNKDVNYRDMLIFGEDYNPEKYGGGIRQYERLSLEILEKLVKEGFVNLEEYQNNSPSIREILEFIRKYPDYLVHGYVVSPDRADYRLSIEGVEKFSSFNSDEEEIDFNELFGLADELIIDRNEIYCWYD